MTDDETFERIARLLKQAYADSPSPPPFFEESLKAMRPSLETRLDDALVIEDPTRPRVQLGDGWVQVAKLDPEQRLRLLVTTPQGLEPAMLWLTEAGLPTTTKAWQQVFTDANARCRRRGVNLRANPHKLRHSYAVITHRQPRDLAQIQE
jgi:hypothetical protein